MKRFLSYGLVMLWVTFSSYAQTLVPVEENGKYGYQDEAGEWIIHPTFDKAEPFSKGELPMAHVRKNKKEGFIDMSGRFIIQCIFDETDKQFISGVLAVCQNGKWGYVDLNGQILVPVKYQRGRCMERFDKAMKAAEKMRTKRYYEIVERRIRSAAEVLKKK